MKKTTKILTLLLLAVWSVCLVACNAVPASDLWEDAVYAKDAEFGNGAKTVLVEVIAEDHSVTFTLHTDAETLGDALLAHSLIAGEEGEYGLYIKVVNGMTADYDVNQRYWSFTKNGEMMMTGVDGTAIADGEHYELTYAQ